MFVNKITAHLVGRTSSQHPSQWDLFGIYISTWTWNSMTMNHRAIMAYEDEICQMPQQKSASAVIKVRGYFREKNQATTVTTPPNRLQQHYLGTEGWPHTEKRHSDDRNQATVSVPLHHTTARQNGRKPGYSGSRASSTSRKTSTG